MHGCGQISEQGGNEKAVAGVSMAPWPQAAAVVLTLSLLFCFPGTARAEGWNSLLAGLNGILTAPADPVVRTVTPPEELKELPFPEISSRVVGLFTGTALAGYRAVTGAFDIALTPFWVIPTLSPSAEFEIIPGYEVDYRY